MLYPEIAIKLYVVCYHTQIKVPATFEPALYSVLLGSLDWSHCPNVGQASTNRDLRLYPGVCFSYIVTNF